MSVQMRKIVFASGFLLALAALVAAQTRAPVRNGAPAQEELRALIERVVASQHGNDEALAEYERRERQTARKDDGQERITDDKLYRVFPTGTGTVRVLLEEKGKAVKPEAYEKGLRSVVGALENALTPELPKQKEAIAKWEKRVRERRELLDAIPQAFRATWLGREPVNGRTLVKLRLEPDPDYKPHSRNTHMLTHVRATVWVEEKTANLVRVEAEIFEDIPVGGGFLGKVYKGGRFEMEQTEVAPGVWLPARYVYDFDGRKFIFPFSMNETVEASNYRRMGPPEQALAALRRELRGNGSGTARPANGKAAH
jgi:hypothetical protein